MAKVDDLMNDAKKLYARYGEDLSQDKEIKELLNRYQSNITATNLKMQNKAVVKTCSVCATEKAGSCCMQDVEEWYDPKLLLINLLMGAEFPDSRELPGHCFLWAVKDAN